MGRVLAVDYGKVRVGLAVSDPMRRTAQPLDVVERQRGRSLLEGVLGAVREHEVEEIVVGLPLRMDGSEGVLAEAARSFAKALGERAGVPVKLRDERLTSVEASRGMRRAGVTARNQRQVLDKVAAAILLRDYLESQLEEPADVDEMLLPELVARDEAAPPPPAGRKGKARAGAAERRRHPRSSRRDWLEDLGE